MDIDSLELKGKASCFPNWHETQSKFSVDTEPNKSLEANCCSFWKMHDQDEHAKVQGKELKKLQQLQQQKQEQQVEDEGCPRETYAQL